MESFTRQRRNLILISLVLIATRLVDLSLNVDQFSVLGNALHMGRPANIRWVLWVLWAYWLWRCYQAMRDLRRQNRSLGIQEAFDDARIAYACVVAHRKWKTKAIEIVRQRTPDIAQARISRLKFEPGHEKLQRWSVHIVTTGRIYIWVEDREHSGPLGLSSYDKREVQVDRQDFGATVAGWTMLWIYIRAARYVTAHTSKFTDYILPWLIAAAAVLA